jgi:hypothetical protein
MPCEPVSYALRWSYYHFLNLGLCIDPAALSYIIDPASLKLQGSGFFLKLLQLTVLL